MSFIPLHLLSSSPSFSLPLALSHLQLNTAGFQHQKAQLGMQLVFQASRLGALRLPAMCGGFFVVVFFFLPFSFWHIITAVTVQTIAQLCALWF